MVGTTKYTDEQIYFVLDRTVQVIPRGQTARVHAQVVQEYRARYGVHEEFTTSQVRYITERYGNDPLYGNRLPNLDRTRGNGPSPFLPQQPGAPGIVPSTQRSLQEQNHIVYVVCPTCNGQGRVPNAGHNLQPSYGQQHAGYQPEGAAVLMQGGAGGMGSSQLQGYAPPLSHMNPMHQHLVPSFPSQQHDGPPQLGFGNTMVNAGASGSGSRAAGSSSGAGRKRAGESAQDNGVKRRKANNGGGSSSAGGASHREAQMTTSQHAQVPVTQRAAGSAAPCHFFGTSASRLGAMGIPNPRTPTISTSRRPSTTHSTTMSHQAISHTTTHHETTSPAALTRQSMSHALAMSRTANQITSQATSQAIAPQLTMSSVSGPHMSVGITSNSQQIIGNTAYNQLPSSSNAQTDIWQIAPTTAYPPSANGGIQGATRAQPAGHVTTQVTPTSANLRMLAPAPTVNEDAPMPMPMPAAPQYPSIAIPSLPLNDIPHLPQSFMMSWQRHQEQQQQQPVHSVQSAQSALAEAQLEQAEWVVQREQQQEQLLEVQEQLEEVQENVPEVQPQLQEAQEQPLQEQQLLLQQPAWLNNQYPVDHLQQHAQLPMVDPLAIDPVLFPRQDPVAEDAPNGEEQAQPQLSPEEREYLEDFQMLQPLMFANIQGDEPQNQN